MSTKVTFQNEEPSAAERSHLREVSEHLARYFRGIVSIDWNVSRRTRVCRRVQGAFAERVLPGTGRVRDIRQVDRRGAREACASAEEAQVHWTDCTPGGEREGARGASDAIDPACRKANFGDRRPLVRARRGGSWDLSACMAPRTSSIEYGDPGAVPSGCVPRREDSSSAFSCSCCHRCTASAIQ